MVDFDEWQLLPFTAHGVDDLDDGFGHVDAADQRCDGNHFRAFMLHHAEIHFTQPDEVVLAAIQILYLSIIHINRIGPNLSLIHI